MFLKYFVHPWFLKYKLYLPDTRNTDTKEDMRDRSFFHIFTTLINPSDVECSSR